MSTTIFPSINTWITPRSEQGQITTENSLIVMPQKINKIDKVILHVPNVVVDITSTSIDTNNGTLSVQKPLSKLYIDAEHTTSIANLDVSKFVVEKSKYYALSTYNADVLPGFFKNLYTNNTWYYEHNENTVTLVNKMVKGNFEIVGSPVSAVLIASAVHNYFYNNGKKDGKLYFYDGLSVTTITYSDDMTVEVLAGSAPDIRTIPFRIYYTPLGESVKLQVPKTNPQATQFCIPYGQQQPIVDNVTLGREMQSVANRAGCETKEVVRTLHNISEKRKLGTVYREKDASGKFTGNIWRLTSERVSVYSETYIIVEETWSKNWSYQNPNVPINREFRSWNIPADIVQRNLLWQDYCLIKRVNDENDTFTLGKDDTVLSEWAKNQILNFSYDEETATETECTNMWFYQVNDKLEQHGVALNCSAFGFGNSLVFSGKTKDNLSAGVQRVKINNNDYNYQFCKDVYYCDKNGEIDEMCIQVGSRMEVGSAKDVQTEALYMYPEFKTEEVDGGVTFLPYNAPHVDKTFEVGRGRFKLFKENSEFKILKDPCEQINFTYQLHMLTDDGLFIVGSSWAANCPLVKQQDGSEKMQIWKLKQYLPQGAQVMTANYGDVVSEGVSVSLDDNTITFNAITDAQEDKYVGWCATDENSNILFAYNGRDGAKFKLHYKHDYDAIAKALKK